MIDRSLFEVAAAARKTYYTARDVSIEADREEHDALDAWKEADAALQTAVRAELDAIEATQ